MLFLAYAGFSILFEREFGRDLLGMINFFISRLFFMRMLFLAYAGISIFNQKSVNDKR